MYGPAQSLDFCTLQVVMAGGSFTDVLAVILSHCYSCTSCNRAFHCFLGAFLLVQIYLVAKRKTFIS